MSKQKYNTRKPFMLYTIFKKLLLRLITSLGRHMYYTPNSKYYAFVILNINSPEPDPREYFAVVFEIIIPFIPTFITIYLITYSLCHH